MSLFPSMTDILFGQDTDTATCQMPDGTSVPCPNITSVDVSEAAPEREFPYVAAALLLIAVVMFAQAEPAAARYSRRSR